MLYGMIYYFDWEVGCLLKGMCKLGVLDNIIIFVMSDNGFVVNNWVFIDVEWKIWNINGFKGWKGNFWENGLCYLILDLDYSILFWKLQKVQFNF